MTNFYYYVTLPLISGPFAQSKSSRSLYSENSRFRLQDFPSTQHSYPLCRLSLSFLSVAASTILYHLNSPKRAFRPLFLSLASAFFFLSLSPLPLLLSYTFLSSFPPSLSSSKRPCTI